MYDPTNPEFLSIECHPKWVHVHPVVLAMLACLEHGMSEDSISISGNTPTSFTYLTRMGLFKHHKKNTTSKSIEHDPSGRFIPITQITDSESLDEFISQMVPLLHTSPDQARPIKYVISELIRNTLEHSRSSSGAFICAQYFKKANRISIGIADSGIGILKALSFCHRPKTHIDAIEMATEPGITGATSILGGNDTNGGAGLYFIKRIANATNNYFVIYSGTGLYKQLVDKSKNNSQLDMFQQSKPLKYKKTNHYPNWQGTITGFDFSLNRSDSFQSILNEIKKTFNLDMRQQKKEVYKRRARFI